MTHVLRFTLPLFVWSSLAVAAPSALETQISTLTCEQFLTTPPNKHPGPAPELPSALKTWMGVFTSGLQTFERHRVQEEAVLQHRRDVHAFERDAERLSDRRAEALGDWQKQVAKTLGPVVEPALQPLAADLARRGQTMLAEAVTLDQLRAIRARVGALALELRAEFDEILEERRRTVAAQLRQRRLRELRFDVAQASQGIAVVSALVDLAPAEFADGAVRLTARVTNDVEVRAFAIREIQMIRRLRRVIDAADAAARGPLEEGLRMRLANDAAILGRGDADPARLNQLRRATLALNRPGLFRDVAPGGTVRRLRLLEREQIVADALANDELEVTILQAGLDLIAPPAQPPLPRQPSMTPPTVPDIPRKARSRSHASSLKAQIAQYKSDVEAWKASWTKYKSDVVKYKESTIPAYVARVRHLREAFERCFKARQSFVAYLAYRRPAQFASPAVAERTARASTAAAHRRLDAAPASSVSRRIRAAAPSSDTSSNDWMMYWLLFHNSMNPYYVTNPYAAHAAYAWDAAECSKHGSPVPGVELPADVRQQMNELNQQFTPEPVPTPDLGAPLDLNAPDLDLRDLGSTLDLPNIDVPTFDAIPDLQIPDISIPDISIPDVPTPSFDTPSFDSSPSYSDSSSSYSSYSDSSSSSSSSDSSSSF